MEREDIIHLCTRLSEPELTLMLGELDVSSALLPGTGAAPAQRVVQAVDFLVNRGLSGDLEARLQAVLPNWRSHLVHEALKVSVAGLTFTAEEARALYEECLPRRTCSELSLDPSAPLIGILDHLLHHGHEAPLVRLARRIRERLDVDAATRLDQKLTRAIAEWKLKVAGRARSARPSEPAPTDAEHYSILELTPSFLTPDTYQARAWLWLAGKRTREPLLERDTVTRAGLPDLICQFHDAILARRGSVARDQICVELRLPDELFGEDLDCCPVKLPGHPDRIPLGQHSPVVLRWNHEAADPEIDRANLAARYALLACHGLVSTPIPEYTRDATLGPCAHVDPDRWTGVETHVALGSQPNLVFCRLTHLPKGNLSRCALRGLLTGGVPALLWSRSDEAPSDDHIVGRPLSGLRDHIFRVRTSADPQKGHLALVWENPNRMPPRRAPLRAAKSKGST